jgi:hypothetical protein
MAGFQFHIDSMSERDCCVSEARERPSGIWQLSQQGLLALLSGLLLLFFFY